MFQRLGNRVVRHWRLSLAVWLVLAVCANGILTGWLNKLGLFAVQIPGWQDIAEDGEFAFLPKDMPSIQAENLFRKAFPNDHLASSVVIVVRHRSTQIDDNDRNFISTLLTPRLEAMQAEPNSIIEKVRDFSDNQVGKLLNSSDGKATLIIVELKSEFLDHRNKGTIDRIEGLIDSEKGELRKDIPPGLHLALSGPATVGRDMLNAANESASSTESWTMILVIGLLLAIYRAPFIALIPLVCVFISVQISMALLILMTWAGKGGFDALAFLKPFVGLRTYIAVVTYGAGIDYCLFLIARYKEEYDHGLSVEQAMERSLEKVGAALMASAGTVMCGIGMMVFALFGKFQQAGLGISFSLFIMLICSLTFTPALIKLAGGWAFWPQMRNSGHSRQGGWVSGTTVFTRWIEQHGVHRIWEIIGAALMQRPGAIWLGCVVAMLPFAVVGVIYHSDLSYGLLSELPPTTMSVVGAKAVQEHFAAGETGPITVLLHNPKLDFTEGDTFDALDNFVTSLTEKKDELGLSDIRSVIDPLGLKIKAGAVQKGVARKRYISNTEGYDQTVVRLDLVLKEDPFSRDSMRQMAFVQEKFRELLPESIKQGTEIHYVGTTASILDLKTVTDWDQIIIDGAVLTVVFIILVLLLRMVSISGYLVLSVFFSYFVSLGMTILVFWAIDPAFAGIDWKVPIFLFTILIAVGEDYNIFLMARIDEDQHKHGPVEGIRTALLSTGSIISSCGIIMAGTFFSLVLAGHLRGSQQLGFALAFGVLLDTFVVRPILVPAWLIMLNTNRFGKRLSYLLGAKIAPPE
jgi:RND superfamily putative drug exporter